MSNKKKRKKISVAIICAKRSSVTSQHPRGMALPRNECSDRKAHVLLLSRQSSPSSSFSTFLAPGFKSHAKFSFLERITGSSSGEFTLRRSDIILLQEITYQKSLRWDCRFERNALNGWWETLLNRECLVQSARSRLAFVNTGRGALISCQTARDRSRQRS